MNSGVQHNNNLPFYVASYDKRNVAIKRDTDYQGTINLIKKSYSTLRFVDPQNIRISTTLPEYDGMEIEISEEAWPDIVSGVKAINIVLDRPPSTSQLASGPPDITTKVSSSPSSASLGPSSSSALGLGSPELPSSARKDETPKEAQISMTNKRLTLSGNSIVCAICGSERLSVSSTIDDTIGALRALIHQLNDRHPINPMLAPLVAVSAPSRTPDLEEIVPPIPKPPLSMQEGHGGMISGSIHNLGSGVDYEAGSDDGTKSIDQSRMDEEEEDEEETLIMQGGTGIPIGRDGLPKPLLPPLAVSHAGRKCLVLDLDETLIHSSFKLIPDADYVVPVEIEQQWHNVHVIKRPGVDNFLNKMSEMYEIVVFTGSLSKYASPVLDRLDIHKVISHRLYRESCLNHKGNYVKDLSQLGRPLSDIIVLDNSPASYIFHPDNAVPISSWFNDPHDAELTGLCYFLSDLRTVDDVRGPLSGDG